MSRGWQRRGRWLGAEVGDAGGGGDAEGREAGGGPQAPGYQFLKRGQGGSNPTAYYTGIGAIAQGRRDTGNRGQWPAFLADPAVFGLAACAR